MTRFATFDAIELAVLSAVMAFPDRALPLVPALEIADFAKPFRRHAFEAVRNLAAAGKPIHVVALADEIFTGYQLANHGKCTVHDECRILAGLGLVHMNAEAYTDVELERLLPRHARQLRTIRYAREERMAG